MNPLAWILDSLKVHPEPVSIPDVSELTPIQLAEIRSRLQTFSQVANELRKLVDQELAGKIPKALRYGDDVYRPSNGNGAAKVQDQEAWWFVVADAVVGGTVPDAADLLASLFPANSVRLTALPKLAAAGNWGPEALKDTFIVYDPPSTPLSVMPIQKAPAYLRDLEEGELR